MKRADRIHLKGTFINSDEACTSVHVAGDAALVFRGVPRVLILQCPCGCLEKLIVNLDHRAGPAWRLYQRDGSLTIYPSYWRDTQCGSHFILWSNRIYWCDWKDYDNVWQLPSHIEERVRSALPSHYVSYEKLAGELNEIPWDVFEACRRLVRQGEAMAHPDWNRGEFRRIRSGLSRLSKSE